MCELCNFKVYPQSEKVTPRIKEPIHYARKSFYFAMVFTHLNDIYFNVDISVVAGGLNRYFSLLTIMFYDC